MKCEADDCGKPAVWVFRHLDATTRRLTTTVCCEGCLKRIHKRRHGHSSLRRIAPDAVEQKRRMTRRANR